MSLFGRMSISGSLMTAERLHIDVIAENLANADSTRGADGQPYRRKQVVLGATGGGSFQDVFGAFVSRRSSMTRAPARRSTTRATPTPTGRAS